MTRVEGKKTSYWFGFGMFRHPARAAGSYSSGPPAASTVWIKSTGGLNQTDGSPCTMRITQYVPVSCRTSQKVPSVFHNHNVFPTGLWREGEDVGAGAAQDQGDLRQPVEVESAKVIQDGTGSLQPDIPGMCTNLVLPSPARGTLRKKLIKSIVQLILSLITTRQPEKQRGKV